MIPVEVTKISFYPPSKGYAVVLQEVGGKKRKLPVIVGSFEAQAIALALENVDTPRPMTHDLITTILQEVSVNVKEVVITHLAEGTFYAEIRVESDGMERCEVDSRPSDAIAIALRLGTPILVSDSVMTEAGLREESHPDWSGFEELQHGGENSRRYLEEQLQKAIDEEEYEVAAEIRDKIMRLEGKK
ncbi:MAG: bifunctional nuclease domain-containing protein [Fidelibacterota bacterium]